MSKRQLYIDYASFYNIPFIDVNLFDKNSEINLVNPISQKNMLSMIKDKINSSKKKVKEKNPILINFYLLQSYPHIDMGWILSGFLSSGKLEIGQNLLWYDYDQVPVVIDSIYQ